MIYKYYMKTGEKRVIVTKNSLTVTRLQLLVGGHYTFIPWKDTLICVNRDGKDLNLPPNPCFPEFYGDVVVGKSSERGTRFVGFTDEEITQTDMAGWERAKIYSERTEPQ